MDAKERKFVYENDSEFQVCRAHALLFLFVAALGETLMLCWSMQVLPTFGVVVPSGALMGVAGVEGLSFNPMMLLHGEQARPCNALCRIVW